jgi:hypothetical protein
MVEMVALGGAAFGIAVHMFANSIRKLPLTRFPYMHVAFGVAGYYLFPMYDKKVNEAVLRKQEQQKEKMERNISFRT